MKTKLILALFIGTLGFSSQAQVNTTPLNEGQTQKPAITPEKAAENQANKATKALTLTDDQKRQFQAFSLTRINAVRPLREKIKAETDKEAKKTMQKEMYGHYQTFNNNISQILTAEQKTKWEEHKKATKEQNAAKKEAKVPFED